VEKDPAAVLDDNAEPGWGEENRRLAFLRRVELFRGLNREALITVAMELQPKSVVEGAIVCRENDRVDDFYLIESGTLVMTVDVGGHFAELARLGAGQFFGEAALLGLGVHGAAVRAVTPARLWTLSGADFRELMNRVPALSVPVEAASATFEAGLRQRLFEVESRNLAALAAGQSQIRIGRDPDNDLVFESRLVSKHHAVLERTPEGW
jgi:ABC transport system ATP-binding/permease protein